MEKMSDLNKKMYFNSNNGKLDKKPFQSRIEVSINATIDLYKELKSEGIIFLLTSRINQDALENVFFNFAINGWQQ